MTIADIIRIKEERGYSVALLSEYSGVPVGTLQKLLRGDSANPREATLAALERVLLGEESRYPGKAYQYRTGGQRQDLLREPPAAYGAARRKKRQGEYTLEDYYALPEEQRVEMIDGVFYDMNAPIPLHQQIAGAVYSRILDFVEEHEGGCMPFIAPTDVQLNCDNRTMVQPDVFILCDTKRLKRFGIYGAPDFVLEVLSASTKKKDMTIKLAKYLEAGVKEYWVIDPDKRILIVYLNEEEGIPHIYPLQGEAGIHLYDGKLRIDLGRLDRMIERFQRLTGEGETGHENID